VKAHFRGTYTRQPLGNEPSLHACWTQQHATGVSYRLLLSLLYQLVVKSFLKIPPHSKHICALPNEIQTRHFSNSGKQSILLFHLSILILNHTKLDQKRIAEFTKKPFVLHACGLQKICFETMELMDTQTRNR